MTKLQNGDESSGWWGLRHGWGGRREGAVIRGQLRDPCADGMFRVWMYQCPHPPCDTKLESCEMSPLGVWVETT